MLALLYIMCIALFSMQSEQTLCHTHVLPREIYNKFAYLRSPYIIVQFLAHSRFSEIAPNSVPSIGKLVRMCLLAIYKSAQICLLTINRTDGICTVLNLTPIWIPVKSC